MCGHVKGLHCSAPMWSCSEGFGGAKLCFRNFCIIRLSYVHMTNRKSSQVVACNRMTIPLWSSQTTLAATCDGLQQDKRTDERPIMLEISTSGHAVKGLYCYAPV